MKSIKQKMDERKNEKLKEQLRSTAVLQKNDKICGLATIAKIENGIPDVRTKSDALCKIEDGFAIDILDIEKKEYKIYNNLNEIIKSIELGNLKTGDIFCFSKYDYKLMFPELEFMQSEDEIINFLINYNIKHSTTIYWSFLDDEQKKKLDEIAEDNRKKYKKLYY